MNTNRPKLAAGPLVTVVSTSNPDKTYQLTVSKDEIIYCNCPSWRFQKGTTQHRTCKHVREFLDQNPGIAKIVELRKQELEAEIFGRQAS